MDSTMKPWERERETFFHTVTKGRFACHATLKKTKLWNLLRALARNKFVPWGWHDRRWFRLVAQRC